MRTDQPSATGYIKTLDGWRAIAIASVVIAHSMGIIENPNKFEEFLLSFGVHGVLLFFAISGFIISLKLFKEIEKHGSIDLKDFYKRRFFRIIPTSFVYLMVLSLFSYLGYIHLVNNEILASLFSWRNYLRTEDATNYTAIFWSLSVEEHFYLILPAFLVVVKRSRHLISLIVFTSIIIIWRKLGTVPSFLNLFPFAEYHLWNTFGRLDGLINGVILAFFYFNYPEMCKRILSKVPALLILVIYFLPYFFRIPQAVTIRSMLYPIFIFKTINNPTSLFSKILETPFFRFFGKTSYSLYVWHPLFCYKMPHSPAWLQALSGHWYSIFISIFISYLSYRFLETPIRNLGHKQKDVSRIIE